ncbi:50S ribosomal protein L4 [Candidatus Woesearchaeota archaeon]|nr:50S ribosomal protein L4 [Candidatus Woesearchaeota archaeon]
MKVSVISASKEKKKEIELPSQFNEEVRADIILRAVLAIQSNRRQRYGASPEAGKRASAVISRRRHDYRGAYGHGISRVPRKILTRRGTRMYWVGAFAPGTVGGRRAHPPKASKVYSQKINKKERRKAIRSAIAASIIKELVEQRGHKVPNDYPFVLESKIEDIKKTKDIKSTLEKIGLKEELKRASIKTIRAGKGKSRGRKYKKRAGPLLVVSKECSLMSSASNIPGINIVEVKNINAELLAPGAVPGRLTLWSEAAIEKLGKEKLFM